MADIIQVRRDTAANWTSVNPTLAQGELGVELDTSKFKVGDGSTGWASLPYLIDTAEYLTAAGTFTLTNKIISYTDNTLTGVASTSTLQTLTNKTLQGATLTNGYTEEVFALGTSGSLALEPDNGSIQTCALTGAPTFTDGLSAGQSIVLMLTNGASYTVTWPTLTWVTSAGNVAPTLTAADALVFWKISTTLYGAVVGNFV